MDINLSAKIDKIISLPFEDIKENEQNVADGQMDGKTDGQRENSIPPTNTVCGVCCIYFALSITPDKTIA